MFPGCSPDFFLIYKYDTQLSFKLPPWKKICVEALMALYKNLGRFYRVPFKSLLRVQIKRAVGSKIMIRGKEDCKVTVKLWSSCSFPLIIFYSGAFFFAKRTWLFLFSEKLLEIITLEEMHAMLILCPLWHFMITSLFSSHDMLFWLWNSHYPCQEGQKNFFNFFFQFFNN